MDQRVADLVVVEVHEAVYDARRNVVVSFALSRLLEQMVGLLVLEKVEEGAQRTKFENEAELVRAFGPTAAEQVHEVWVVERGLEIHKGSESEKGNATTRELITFEHLPLPVNCSKISVC